MTRLLALILIIVAASPSTATVIPADHLRPSSGNLSPSKGTPERVSTVTVSTEVAGAVADGPGSTVPPGAKVGTVLGKATFYDTCRLCGAASGELQAAIGKDWLDSIVTVSRGGREVTIRLDTGCGCSPRDGVPTVIDLSEQAFYRLLTDAERRDSRGKLKTHERAISDVGVQMVVVSWASGPTPTAPPTDTEVP